MAAYVRLLGIISILLPATLVLAPVQIGAMRFHKPLARRIPVVWHRLALWLVGVRVNVRGRRPDQHPLLIVSNHISWADILVLGSVMPLCFIAKSEMTAWPGINWLAWMQRTVFVRRDDRRDSKRQADTIAARLLEGDAMVLFAEGTTGDGVRLRPFKSALFGAVHAALIVLCRAISKFACHPPQRAVELGPAASAPTTPGRNIHSTKPEGGLIRG